MIKILLVNTLYPPNVIGGAERSVQFLAEGLVKRGFEVVVVSTAPGKKDTVEQVNGVKVYYLSLANLYWPFSKNAWTRWLRPVWHILDSYNPLMSIKLAHILETERPGLVHTNNLANFSVAVWREVKKHNLPLVHTLRDYYLLCPRSTMFEAGKNCPSQCLKCRMYAIPRRIFSGLVDAVVGNSRFILNRHICNGYFARARIRQVIFNAYQPPDKIQHFDTINRISQPLRLGYIGRLHPSKGIELLLQVAQSWPKGSLEVIVAGRGEPAYETELARRFACIPVRWLGFVSPQELLNEVDLLVVPSIWHEPLPRVAFEAYAHGLPVIGSNRGGISEIIEEGRTGFLFDPDVPETLEIAIRRFIENPSLALNMRMPVLDKAQEFYPERILNRYIAIYSALCERGATHEKSF